MSARILRVDAGGDSCGRYGFYFWLMMSVGSVVIDVCDACGCRCCDDSGGRWQMPVGIAVVYVCGDYSGRGQW